MIKRLKARENDSHPVAWSRFEGARDRHDLLDFVAGGIYYGQLVEGVREGYGVLYCTNSDGDQMLYECEWELGLPVSGRMKELFNGKWSKYEGRFDAHYSQTGVGTWSNEDGHKYQGQFLKGDRQGQGKYTWPDGQVYEGRWREGKKHGSGKLTYANGSFKIGEYVDDREVGRHQKYSKVGNLIVDTDYDK
ncbi:hypothetical protein FGO68_gene16597 [Halteria grandinella]|uniref:Uncharacterized protein n=1 Tax=Halteria grandinella TaxID=5974 RepID=A0A8J8T3H9_HALGN|nr:hypothetical protein FGO68_gene16597 [Halteria grandinella]